MACTSCQIVIVPVLNFSPKSGPWEDFGWLGLMYCTHVYLVLGQYLNLNFDIANGVYRLYVKKCP